MAVTKDGSVNLNPDFFGQKTIVLSKSGHGKSYTARVIIEEGIKQGNTFTIIDPQDAYLNMPTFAYINADNVKSARSLGLLLAQTNRNVVVRMKRISGSDQNKFLKAFLSEFRRNIQKGIQTVVIDEAHKYAPEQEKTEAKEDIRGMFQENRSDGLGIIAVTQRISRIDKTILAQADNLVIGKVTAFRDKEAVKNYIDDPNDLEKISSLEIGEFYFYGLERKEPMVAKVREAETEHSGNAPKNLLNEDKITYDKHIKKIVKGDKMGNENIAGNDIVNKVIPSMDGFLDLAKLGAKVSIGGAIGGIAGTLLGARFRSPIPMVSSRTLGGLGTTVALYMGYRMIKMSQVKDLLKYSAAGSAVFTLGSVTFDLLSAFNVRMPNLATFALATATGASPAVVEGSQSESGTEVDLNTEFA